MSSDEDNGCGCIGFFILALVFMAFAAVLIRVGRFFWEWAWQ